MSGSGDFTFLPREGVWAMAQEKARDLLVIEWHLQNIAIQALVRSRPVAMSVRSKTIFIHSNSPSCVLRRWSETPGFCVPGLAMQAHSPIRRREMLRRDREETPPPSEGWKEGRMR